MLAYRFRMLLRAVTLVPIEAVERTCLRLFRHPPVARDLGNDRRRADAAPLLVAAYDGLMRIVKRKTVTPVDQ